MVNVIRFSEVNYNPYLLSMHITASIDLTSTSAVIYFFYNGAFDTARSVRSVSGCTLLRDVKLAFNELTLRYCKDRNMCKTKIHNISSEIIQPDPNLQCYNGNNNVSMRKFVECVESPTRSRIHKCKHYVDTSEVSDIADFQ